MSPRVRAIVFKTPQFNATLQFFEQVVQLPFIEKSNRHFVIHSKGMRLVFVESDLPFSIEFYVNHPSASNFENWEDPNGINVITVP